MKTYDADVIIIGAGASGIAAAHQLVLAGYKVIILEARSTVGGRIYTQHTDNIPHAVELGAEFIHGLPDELINLIPKLNHNLIYNVLDCRYRLIDQKLSLVENFWEDMSQYLKNVKKATKNKDISLSSYIKTLKISNQKKHLVKDFIEGFNACDAEKVSARSLQDTSKDLKKDGAKMARITDGYNIVLKLLIDQAGVNKNIKLNTAVDEINWQKEKVQVCSKKKRWTAKKLLVTVPIGVLKSSEGDPGAITFNPPLEKKKQALSNFEMGQVVKMVLHFDEAVWKKWQDKDKTGFIHFGADQGFQVMWNLSPVKIPVFIFWAGGPMAEKLREMTEHQVLDLALRAFQKAFGLKRIFVQKHLKKYFFHDWNNDPFAKGAYAYIKVNGLECQKVLAKPEKKTIYFAGEAINIDGAAGTVDAAIASGRAAVKKILNSF